MYHSWNSSADSARPMHRWMLAVPVLLLVIFCTLREGFVHVTAQTLHDASWVFRKVEPDVGARYDMLDDATLALVDGGVLVQSEGIATVRAGEWDVNVWGGSVYVVVQRSSLTVAAFDVPVLVHGRYGRVVVPPMRQWRASGTALPDPTVNPAVWMRAVHTTPLPASFIRERRPIVREEDAPEPLQPDDSLLAGADTPTVAAYALKAKSTRQIAAAVRSRVELRMYALLHPLIRDVSWAFLPEDIAVDSDVWIALLMLPQLEQGDVAVSPLTVHRWGEALRVALNASSDSDATASAVLPGLEMHIARMAEDGYPLRALWFAGALRDAIGSDRVLSLEASAAMQRLQGMTPESLKPAVLREYAFPLETMISKQSNIVYAPIVADPGLEQRARDILIERGAMFTKDSTVRTVSPDMVEVNDVVFGLPLGDRLLRFYYGVERDSVRALIDGQLQPYEVPFTAYMEWEGNR